MTKLREICAAFEFNLDCHLGISHQSTSTSTDIAHVYLISCGRFVKVGMARDVRRRIDELQVASPHQMSFVDSWEFDGPRYAMICEGAAHAMLRNYAHRGEWFTASKKIAALACDSAARATRVLKRKHDAFKREPVNDNVAAHVFRFSPMARQRV